MGRLGLAVAALLLPLAASAQGEPGRGEAPAWKPAFYLDGYYQRDAQAFLVPTVFLDRDRLHLEARYNYEDWDTASLWAGWGFTFGGEERYAKLVPMVGAVFGTTNGVAPGLEIDAAWGRVVYWLELEYVFDLQDSAANFLATWSELYFKAADWFWLGASVQRLKVVASPTEVDVGPMIGFGQPGAPGWSVSLYAYGLTRSEPLFLSTLAVQF